MRRVLCVAALAALVLSIAAPAFAASDLSTNETFKTKCAMCHGPNGEGKAAMKTAPLKDAASKTDAQLTEIITKGKAPKMPAYEGKLSADQIKGLVAAIKGLK